MNNFSHKLTPPVCAETERGQEKESNVCNLIRYVYPSMETRLGELIAKIEANDREIEYINGQALPTGVGPSVLAVLKRPLPALMTTFMESIV